jgi:hypothetical protein
LNDEEFCQEEYSFLRTIAGKMKDITNEKKRKAKQSKAKQSKAKQRNEQK